MRFKLAVLLEQSQHLKSRGDLFERLEHPEVFNAMFLIE